MAGVGWQLSAESYSWRGLTTEGLCYLEMNLESSVEIINTRQLREEMPRVVEGVRGGKRFLVLHRSRPAFELSPPGPTTQPLPPLEEDPIFGWDGVGASEDGLRAADHNPVLYGA